jgi:hypothetical protein
VQHQIWRSHDSGVLELAARLPLLMALLGRSRRCGVTADFGVERPQSA